MGVIDFVISKWHCEDLSSYQTITFILQNKCLNQLRFTPLNTTVFLSQLPNSTHIHHLSSIRLSKCIRNEGRLIFLQEIARRITKSISECWISYINIKRVFQIEIDYTRCNWNPKMLEYNKTHMFLLFQYLRNSTFKKKMT